MEKLTFTSAARVRSRMLTFVGDLIKIAVMLAFVFPFYWMIITAFKPYVESILSQCLRADDAVCRQSVFLLKALHCADGIGKMCIRDSLLLLQTLFG